MQKLAIVLILGLLILAGVVLSKRNDAQPAQPAPMEMLPESSGLHIMADGSVMDAMGKIVEGALVGRDGTVTLPDGRVLMPMADFR